MKRSYLIAIGIQLGSLLMSAQSQPHTYTGVIVNVNCFQAAQIINRNSRGNVPSTGTNAFTGNRYKPLETGRMRKSILKHCLVNPGSTEFALLDESGNFFKLDETGNLEVLSQTTTAAKKITATVTGFVDRGILNVRSLSAGQSALAADSLHQPAEQGRYADFADSASDTESASRLAP